MFRSCCVPYCHSHRYEVKLHKLPINDDKKVVWIKAIASAVSNFDIPDFKVVHRLFVCQKHFEKRFVTDKLRLLNNACPTLFTDEEIANGVATVPYGGELETSYVKIDHPYHGKLHCDHTYAKPYEDSENNTGLKSLLQKKKDVPDPGPTDAKENTGTDSTQILVKPAKNSEVVTYYPIFTKYPLAEGIPEGYTDGHQKDGGHQNDDAQDSLLPGLQDINKNTGGHFKKPAAYPKVVAHYPTFANRFAEGIPDDYTDDHQNDDDAQDSLLPGQQESQSIQEEPVFSWEKSYEVVSTDDADASLGEREILEDIPSEISLYCDDDGPVKSKEQEKEAEVPDYQCNVCREVIVGFRYTCVQCVDFDLCAACEARNKHAHHYVLRVPRDRPYSEIQAVMAAIRQQILSESLFLHEAIDDSLKEEIKEEPIEPPDAHNAPAPHTDVHPMRDTDVDPMRDVGDDIMPEPASPTKSDSEYSHSESSEGSDSDAYSPRRKRTRTRACAQDETQFLTLSSDDSDASPPRRKRAKPPAIIADVALPPAKIVEVALPTQTIILELENQPVDTTCLENYTELTPLNRMLASKLEEQRLAHNKLLFQPVFSLDPRGKLTAINPRSQTQFHRTKSKEPPVTILSSYSLTTDREVQESHEPAESQNKPRSIFVPHVKRRSPRKHILDLTRIQSSKATVPYNQPSPPVVTLASEEPTEYVPSILKRKSHRKHLIDPIQLSKDPTVQTVFVPHVKRKSPGKRIVDPIQLSKNPTVPDTQPSPPVVNLESDEPSEFVPNILKRKSLRKRKPLYPNTQLTKDPTVPDTQPSPPVVNEESVEPEISQEDQEQVLSDPPEIVLRLPEGTDEVALRQALQCTVTVRLKRDF